MREGAKLEVEGVSKRFGDFLALDNVSLRVVEGSVVALLGPSGSGKSTLLRIIGGHDLPDAGDVRVGGLSIVGRPPNKIPTATVFQHYALFPHYDVFHNVSFGLRVRGDGTASTKRRVDEVLGIVGMTGFERRDVTTLSGGERQRIAMARALAIEPEVILMDEPLGALDRLIRHTMQLELADLLHRIGITTVYVTHDQHEAFTLADEIAVMERGRIHQIDTPLQIYGEPVDEFVANFVGGTNFLRGSVIEVTEEGFAAVRTDTGLHVLGRRRGPDVAVGDRVAAMIRPEDVEIIHSSEGTWPASVVGITYVGDVTEYLVELGQGQRVSAKRLGSPRYRSGQRVSVDWRPAHVLVIPGADLEP